MFLVATSLAAVAMLLGSTVQGEIRKTTLDGVYSEAQAARGREAYLANCGGCHKDDLSGINAPPLKDNQFMERWREFDLDVLFTTISANMPPNSSASKDKPRLSEEAYLDILTYILQQNSSPAGTEQLTRVMLENVLLVGKDGPKPLPNNALVQVLGCLTEGADKVWTLTRASEPVRTKTPEETTQEELKAAQTKPLGTLTFRLQNFDYADPNFKPESHRGSKLQAKGYLIRQPNRERINITSIGVVASNCAR